MMPLHNRSTNAVLLCTLWLLGGCAAATNNVVEQFDRRARAAGLVRSAVIGAPFTHSIYARGDQPATQITPKGNDLVLVYLEGDGRPSTRDGRRAAIDPTPRHALALQLMARTAHRAWYLTRPCYNGAYRDLGCTSALWTDARYSEAVIESMVAALTRHARSQGNPKLVLVGYSGGGALAVLMASRLQNIVGVVTVAANLDTERWTQAHDYTPLVDSLNPATDAHPLFVPEIHLVGEQDEEVPFDSTRRYFLTHPQAIVWQYEDYDHRCCWEESWPTLLARALRELTLQ